MMIEKIICAGFGGQGIMAMGKILATSAMQEGKFVTWLPSYGAEVRGGTAHCSVIISTDKIASPCVEKADTLIVLNEPSLRRFMSVLGHQGLLLMNGSMISCRDAAGRPHTESVPVTEIAAQLGWEKVANMVAIGVYLAKKKIITVATMEKAIEEILADKPKLIGVNKRALEAGFFWVQKHSK